MTYQEAITQLCIGAEMYIRHLTDEMGEGPEGAEVYILPRIKRLAEAVSIVEGTNK